MRAAIFNGPERLEVVDYPMAKPGKDEILLKIRACGVCGTDFHIFSGKAPAKPPVVLGHEYVGEVVETGPGASAFQKGEKIAVDPNIYCGYCEFCRKGRINLCKNLKALGVTLNGGLAEYAVVPISQAYRLPGDMPDRIAAFAEPLSCCLHGILKADIQPDESVAILGAGPIGLMMLQLAKHRGAGKTIVIEPSEEKRKLAQILDADYVYDPFEEESIPEILEVTGGGIEKVIECSGNQNAAASAFEISRKGGLILLFGLAPQDAAVSFNLQSFFHKELVLKSSLLNPFTFQTAINLLWEKKVLVDLFDPETVSLDKISLVSLFSGPKDDSVIKYMVMPNSLG